MLSYTVYVYKGWNSILLSHGSISTIHTLELNDQNTICPPIADTRASLHCALWSLCPRSVIF